MDDEAGWVGQELVIVVHVKRNIILLIWREIRRVRMLIALLYNSFVFFFYKTQF